MDPQEQFYLPKGTNYVIRQNVLSRMFDHREIKTDEVAVGCVISFGMSLSEIK